MQFSFYFILILSNLVLLAHFRVFPSKIIILQCFNGFYRTWCSDANGIASPSALIERLRHFSFSHFLRYGLDKKKKKFNRKKHFFSFLPSTFRSRDQLLSANKDSGCWTDDHYSSPVKRTSALAHMELFRSRHRKKSGHLQILRWEHSNRRGNDFRNRVPPESDSFRRIRIVQIAEARVGEIEGFLRLPELHEESC